jgi:hypothetical protein
MRVAGALALGLVVGGRLRGFRRKRTQARFLSGLLSANCTGAGVLPCSSEVAWLESLAVAAMFSTAGAGASSATAVRARAADRLELR